MSQLPDLDDIIRHCDSSFLDEHFAWNADPSDIADQLHRALRAAVLNQQDPEDHETLEEAAVMYRSLRPVIERTMAQPDRWDGDEDEAFHLGRYVQWLAAGQPDDDPSFFQPGHRYAHSQWHFHCATVTAHPETGEHSAIGWLQISDGSWTTYAYSEAAWGDSWVDVTPAGDR